MKYLRLLVPLALLTVLLSCAFTFAQEIGDNPYANPYGSPSPYGSNPYSSPYGQPNSSPRPYTNPYSTPYGQQQQPQRSEPWTPPPPVTRDFNVWKDGKPTLCTATRSGDVYCY
jgi:hypothetical protein